MKSMHSLQVSLTRQWNLSCPGQPGQGAKGDMASPSPWRAPGSEEVSSGHVGFPQQSVARRTSCRFSAEGKDLAGSFCTHDASQLRQSSQKWVVTGLTMYSKKRHPPARTGPVTNRPGPAASREDRSWRRKVNITLCL